MSNIEVVEQIYSAFGRRDTAALTCLLDPEIEIVQTELLPWGGHYKGLPGVAEFFGKIMAHIQSRVETERLIEAGNTIVQIGHTIGKTVRTSEEFRIAEVHVWEIRDGKAISMKAYIDTPGMLRALMKP